MRVVWQNLPMAGFAKHRKEEIKTPLSKQNSTYVLYANLELVQTR